MEKGITEMERQLTLKERDCQHQVTSLEVDSKAVEDRLDSQELLFISSSENDQVVFKMKSDSEELPKIHFNTREARQHRQKHRERRCSNEKKNAAGDKEPKSSVPDHINCVDTYISSDEPPRIPPLPDLNLFCSDSQTEDSNSQPLPKEHTFKVGKTPRARKRRQTIEEIKCKEREIRGALFAVDSESSDMDYLIPQTRNKKSGSKVKRLKDEKGKFPMKKHIQCNRHVKNVEMGPMKTDVNGNSSAKEKKLKPKSSQNIPEGLRSNNSSSESLDWKCDSKEKVPHKKTERNNKTKRNDARVQVNSDVVSTISKSMSEQKDKSESQNMVEVENVSSKKPNFPVHKFDRKVTDKSDTCHQICSRLSSFDLLASLSERYKRELKNLKISPTSKQALKTGLIPVVSIGHSEVQSVVNNGHSGIRSVANIGHSGAQPVVRQKSESVENSESESVNEKSKRHFMDVFSDISEAETDDGVEIKETVNDGVGELGKATEPLNKSFFDKIAETSKNDTTWIYQTCDNAMINYESDEMVLKHDLNQRNVLPSWVISQNVKPLSSNTTSSLNSFDECSVSSYKNYDVEVEGYSDISEDDGSQKQTEDDMTLTENNMPEMEMKVSSQDGGNSTLKVTESDESVIHISSDIDDEMPSLRNEVFDKGCKSQVFEMPILEKFNEVYSSFRNELDDQDMLPDISDEENEMKINSVCSMQPIDCFTPKATAENSSQRSKVTNLSDNIFKKFPLTPAKSSLTSSSKSISLFLPDSSGTSKFSTSPCSLTSSHSDVVLTSPKECSTLKSRKRKMRKSQTCSNFNSVEFKRSYATASSSSHCELMSLTKQIDQLTNHMKNFVKLNEDETALPDILESRKSIVYACEEDGVLNLAHALNFLEDYSRKDKIPSDVCNDIIKAAFYSECKLAHIHWAYNLLSKLNTRRCAEIEITWEMIEHCLKVTLSTGQEKTYNRLLQSALLLQLGVDVLKIDLFTRELSDNREIRKTFAYKMFAYDVSTSNRKRLLYYLNQALHAGQCRTVTNGETFQLPEILPMLQDLLALCVDVSSSCVDCANMLATEMVTTYKFLPNLADKELLLKSISSHLLQCKLVQHVLESQYDCYQVLGGAFPDSLEDIIQCFFKVKPLKNPLTPPTTPNEDNFREDEVFRFADEVTEEIAILLYYAVASYLQASKDKLYIPLRLRVNLPKRKKKLRSEDVEELARMREHVQELEEHLRGMTPDLTDNTEHYLFKMRCRGDHQLSYIE